MKIQRLTLIIILCFAYHPLFSQESADIQPEASSESAEQAKEQTNIEDEQPEQDVESKTPESSETDLQTEQENEDVAQQATTQPDNTSQKPTEAWENEDEATIEQNEGQSNENELPEPDPEQTESFVQSVEKGLTSSDEKTDTSSFEEQLPAEQETETYMRFNFDNEDLTTIINQYAQKKGINIVLPWGEDAIKFKITFSVNEDIPLSKAENYLRLFIHMAGYTMYKHNSYYVIAKKTEKNTGKQPVALYVDTPPSELPRSQEEIRAIYYLRNLKVPQSKGTEPINLILQNLLSSKNAYLFDQKTNGIIISDRSANIAAAMDIILELDTAGSPETIQTLHLKNSDASSIAKMLKEQLIGSVQGSQPQVTSSQGAYFEPTTRVFANARTNTLIIIGKGPSVRRIKEFTQEYLDADPEVGRSVLHVYELQYLDAREFAPTLQKIVQGIGEGEQSKKAEQGSQRFFSGVKVVAEVEKAAEVKEAGNEEAARSKVTVGGNRLLIAANSDDWKRVKRLIQELDKPEKQVIIETMIVDITANKNKELASQTRNPKSIPTPSDTEFQTVNITGNGGNPILDGEGNNKTLISDLLRILSPDQETPDTLASRVTQPPNDSGALILSLGDSCDDGKIWSVLKILDRFIDREVISHPFFVTKNNVKATESRTDIRRATGNLIQDNDTAPIKFQDFKAELAVEVTPHVSSLRRVNLEIKVTVSDFESQSDPNNFNRITREVLTNANLESGQILVLGGLTRVNDQQNRYKVPILGDLPIIGNLFSGSEKSEEKTNLAIFLTPTIVDPKLRSGLNRYTSEKIEEGYDTVSRGDLFDSLKDPITHFFFNGGREGDKEIFEDYLDETSYDTAIYNSYKDPEDYEADMQVAHIDDETVATPFNQEDELRDLLEHEDNPLLHSQTG